MNFSELQFKMKACTLPNIFIGAGFDAIKLDARDVIFNKKSIFTMLKTHIKL